jgi:hypothetical protein
MKYHCTALLLIFSFVSLAFAQPMGRFEANEDLKFIRQAFHEQKAVALAEALDLSAEQVVTLNNMRADADAIKAEYEPQLEAAKVELETLAATLRANVENGAALTEEDEIAVRTARRDIQNLHRAFKQAVREALMGYGDVLTDAQKEIVKEVLKPNLPEDEESAEAQRPQRGSQGARFGGRGGQGGKGAAKVMRVLLSDAFLQAIQ